MNLRTGLPMDSATPAIQERFQDYVLGTPEAGDMQPAILSDISDQYGLPAQERLAIYYNAYRIRIRDALSEAYGNTHAYLGDELFYACCREYLDAHPSQLRNLRWYGAQFPTFLANRLPQHPVVAELAAFEWTLGLAFDAADQPVLALDDLRALAAADWQSLGFDCQASLHFLDMQWNTVAIWLALSEDQDPPPAEKAAAASPWLIWRKNLQAHFRSLTTDERAALQGLQAGQSFATVCALAAEHHPAITPQIAGWLQTWLAEEMLSHIRLPAGA
ncbi:MAG: DNA-binding domain-containing protein [Pseudomonadota bacterium]